jgi:hypothetical protein
MYAKKPDYACDECHRSFKNKRALKMHRKDVHEKPIPEEENRLAVSLDHNGTDECRPAVLAGDKDDK